MEIVTKSSQETKKLGEEVANNLVDSGLWMVDSERAKHQTPNTEHSNVLALTGGLGSGKTTFLQGFASGLGIEQRVISPTFIIMRKYDSRIKIQESRFKNFYHIDLYRLERNVEQDVKNLGLEEIWTNPENIVAIEWAEKIKDSVPKSATWIKFKNLGGESRRISVNRLIS